MFEVFRKKYLVTFRLNFQKQLSDVSCKTGAPKIFAKFTEKRLCRSLFYKKTAGLRTANLFKRDSDKVLYCKFC